MIQEENNETDSNKETEAPAEASGNPTETPGEASSKPIEAAAVASSTPTDIPSEASNKPTETSAEVFTKPTETHAETSTKTTETPAKTFNKSKLSRKKMGKSLKAKPKIMKKSLNVDNLKAKNLNDSSQDQGKETEATVVVINNSADALEEMSNKPKESLEEVSRKPMDTPAKAFNISESSGKKTPKSLKAKSKIVKKSLDVNNLKPMKNTSGPQDRGKEIEAPAEAFKNLNDSLQDQGKETEATVVVINNSADTLEEMSNKPKESLEEVSRKPMDTPAKAFNISESSGKKTPKSLKAKSKIVKKSLDVNNLKPMKNTSGPQDRGKEIEAPVEAFNNETVTLVEVSSKPTETPAETSSKPTEVPAKAFNKSESSGKKSLKSLEADSKIVKCPYVNDPSRQVHGRKKRRNKGRVLQSNKERSHNEQGGAKGLTLREETQSRNIMKNEHSGRSYRAQDNQERIIESKKNQQRQKNKSSDASEKNLNIHKNKGKLEEIENNRRSEKKEKLGGLIFMCSGKTKSDCFYYGVMGISMGKKDLVLGIKPGLKLFLYDFDLKLLYGIYRASSSGGLKLEPKAFGGAFPAQVKFNVEKDCLPLPESVFKKAIKENYSERNKFKTELTIQQVRKLMQLFRSAEVHSSALPPRVARTHEKGIHKEERESLPYSHRKKHARDRYANDDARSRPVLSRERDQNVAYQDMATMRREETRNLFITEKEYRAYGLSGERSLTHHSHFTAPSLDPYHRDYEREHVQRPSHFTAPSLDPYRRDYEREHVQRPSHFTAPSLDPYRRDYEREHVLRRQSVIHRESVPTQRETLRADPIYLDDKEYQAYSLGTRRELVSAAPATTTSAIDTYAKDPYNGYYQSSSSLAAQRREEVPSSYSNMNGRRDTYLLESDPLRRREADRVDRLYSNYDVDPPLHGDRQKYQAVKPEPMPMPVSSRYSFRGPSFSYG